MSISPVGSARVTQASDNSVTLQLLHDQQTLAAHAKANANRAVAAADNLARLWDHQAAARAARATDVLL